MTKTFALICMISLSTIIACKKSTSDSPADSPANPIALKNIEGSYAGGTMDWGQLDIPYQGIDANLTAKVEFTGPDKIRITFNTTVPVLETKTYEFTLISKTETSLNGSYSFEDTTTISLYDNHYISALFSVYSDNSLQTRFVFYSEKFSQDTSANLTAYQKVNAFGFKQ